MRVRSQTKLIEKRINWLMDNSDLWYDLEEVVDVEWYIEELKNKMRRAGLYHQATRNSSMNITPLLQKARKRLDKEAEYF